MFRIPRRARLAFLCAGLLAATLSADVQASDRSTLATGKIAYQKNRGIGQINPDGTGKITLYKHKGYRQCCMDWSPDGSQLLAIDYSNKNFEKQALLSIGELETIRLAHQRFNVFDASWSPDGDWVVFTAQGPGKEGLWIVDELGNERERVYNKAVSGPLRWSPDGMNVAFQRYAKGRGIIGYYSRDTREVYELTTKEFDANDPHWSPLEDKVYFLHVEPVADQFGNFVLYRMGADGQNVEQLTDDDESVYGYDISPDGSKIAALICCSDEEGASETLYVMGLDGSDRVQVDTDGTAGGVQGDLFLHTWAPDSSMFIYEKVRSNAFSRATLEYALYSALPDGSDTTQLIDQEGITFADWAPDSTGFATCRFDGFKEHIGVYDFAAGEHSTLTNGCFVSWGA